MLEELSIRNYALIDSISLSFGIGFNVLTGETGAGKSIIVDSLSFLMGAKTGEEIIRTGCDEASVTALVSIKDTNREALDWLAGRDIETEDGTVIIRRTVKKSGRSSVFIQNVPLTRTDLADFMGLLFDLHGQHNHESLLKKENHRRYLDRFAGIEDEVAAFTGVFTGLSEKRKALESSLSDERDRGTRLELLAYAAEEITKAAVRAGEIRELENESQRLSDFEKLANLVTSTAESLYDGELSVLSLARNARTSIDAAAAIDNALAETQKRLDDLFYEADDISREFRSYRDQLTYDPRRLAEVDERLALLYQLKKKYAQAAAPNQGAEDAILEYLARSQAEIETLSGAGENREKLIGEIAVLEKDLAARAASLRQKRKAAALRLGDAITGILKSLGMPNACFSVSLLPKGRAPAPEKENTAGQQGSQSAAQGSQSAGLVCGPWGAEDVEFLISANTGEPLKDLSRIASGGELSRVMLAIKTVICGGSSPGNSSDSIETMIFDEIDTGIGGEVALAVGEHLTEIGKSKQIFCVTHLASIAVRSDNHFKVEKHTEGGRTFTGVGPLNAQERRYEIARMLSGDCGAPALAHADDLIVKYGKRGN